MNLALFRAPDPLSELADEARILAEGQKDGERNIPEMGSYSPAPFEQALIAHGEQVVQRIYKAATQRIGKLRSLYDAYYRRLQELERLIQPVADAHTARVRELGRDAKIVFHPVFHWILIAFLGIGEFPLNTVVFRLFGEAEYMTYVMASTLAIMIPLIGVFIGVHLRHSLPGFAGNVLIGVLTPVTVGVALYAVSLLRNTYISTQLGAGAAGGAAAAAGAAHDGSTMAMALFALNSLVFFGAVAASYFAHDPDERLDGLHQRYVSLDRKRNMVRKRLYSMGTKLNSQIQQARSQIEQARALTNQRIALYRQTNIRFRRLLPPPSFRRSPEFPPLQLWPEVPMNHQNGVTA